MPDPESSTNRDDGLRRGSNFEPTDDRIWELPVQDAASEPERRRPGLTSNALIIGIVVLILIIGLLVVLML